jgi:hypothetical protein
MAKKKVEQIGHSKEGKTRRLAKAALGLLATAVLKEAVQTAANDPRVRRKAKAVGRAIARRAKTAGRKMTRTAKRARGRQPRTKAAHG